MIQSKIIEGTRGLTLESHHKQLIVYAVLYAKNHKFLKRLCLKDPNLSLIYIYDEKSTAVPELKHLFSIGDGDMRSFVVNLSKSYENKRKSPFNDCNDMDLRGKLFVKMLTELSKLSPESLVSECSKHTYFDILEMFDETLPFDKLGEKENIIFSNPKARKNNAEVFKTAFIKLLDSTKP